MPLKKIYQPTNNNNNLVCTLAKRWGLSLDFQGRAEINVFVEVTSEKIDAGELDLGETDLNINLQLNISKS